MYYLAINGQKTGPYEAHDIQRMLRQGAIGYETLFWKDGMFDWAAIGSQRQQFETAYQSPPAYRQPQTYQEQEYQLPGFHQAPYARQEMQAYQQPMMAQQQMMVQQQMMMNPPKSRVAYILLAFFLGGLGIHNFYAGYTGKGVAQLLLTLLLFWTIVVPVGVWIWIIVEMCTVDRDASGNPLT
jgi:TM2 domain-containing membrane protein YozV